jgi:hypothetical protein
VHQTKHAANAVCLSGPWLNTSGNQEPVIPAEGLNKSDEELEKTVPESVSLKQEIHHHLRTFQDQGITTGQGKGGVTGNTRNAAFVAAEDARQVGLPFLDIISLN